MAGYYKLQRGIFEHYVFKDEPFTEREAWIWLIEQASFKPHKIRFKSSIVEVQRGQVPTSYRKLKQKFKWGNQRIIKYLTILEKEGMILKEVGTQFLTITICNYDKFQDNLEKAGTQIETQAGTEVETQAGTNRIKGNKRKEKDISKDISKKKISLDDLKVDHVREWLIQKRSIGKYLNHDENHILEVFRNYCKSKGRVYKDYVAAYKNAFDWERSIPSKQQPKQSINDSVTVGLQRALDQLNY